MNRAEKRRQQKLTQKAAKQNTAQPAAPSVEPPLPAIQQSLETAVQHHAAGRLSDAEHLYQQILQTEPNHPSALNLLGLVAHQVGKNDVAVELMTKAISIKPDYVEAHSNLGNAYSGLGRLEDAMECYRKALAIEPAYAQAHSNLAAALQGQGKLDEARTHYRKALAIKPNYVEAHNNLGAILRELGEWDAAAASYHTALSIKPDYANAHNGLGLVLQDMGKHEQAENCFQKALTINPDFVEALANRGATLQNLGNPDAAVASCRKALSINPDFAEAHNNLGIAFKEQGKFEDALASYQMAIAIKPDYCEALNNYGSVLHVLGRFDEAVATYHKALSIKPNYTSAHSNLGATLHGQGKFHEAASSCRKALSVDPEFADAHNNLGNALKDLGKLNEAIASYQKAISIKPEYAQAHSNLATALQGAGKLEAAMSNCRKAISIKPDFAEAHSNLIFIQGLYPKIDQAEQHEELERWNERFILPLGEKIQPHGNNRDPDRRLRIGYVSADFCLHSAYLGFGPLILEHDRKNFDIICYDATVVRDDVHEKLRAAATDWRDIRSMNDDELAQAIRDDAIDILVDLSGHTRGNRLKLFGHKPAPLQVTGIGHLAPGLSTIDYRLTTDRLTPPEKEKSYPEKPIYLNTYFGFTPPPNSPPVGPTPCLKNGFMTFGYLGRVSRVSDEVLALWARILGDIPGSRLLLKNSQLDDPSARQKIQETFSALSIAEDRLTLLGKTSQPEHLDAHNRVDLVFDTIPHGGGMTTMDSLWMGVPVIGLLNPEKVTGRLIECICKPLKLEQWIAHSLEQYHAIAVGWAGRGQDLVEIRQGLRQRLWDVYSSFPRDVEKSYRLIWKRWCTGETPTPLYPLTSVEQDYADAIEHHRNGRWAEAEAAYRKVLAANPEMPSALLNLGAVVLQSGNYNEATDLSRRAIALNPDHGGAHNNLGTGLQKLGRLDEAVAAFQIALTLAPDDAALHNNMANALVEKGAPEQAIPYFEKALVLKPDYAEAYFNMGTALKNLRRLEDAVLCFERSIAIDPLLVVAHYNLGRACSDSGQLEKAVSSYHRTLELKPDYQEAHSSLIFIQDLIPDIDQTEQQAERGRWNDKFIVPLAGKILPHSNGLAQERRLRIGYVSADFRRHSAYLGFGPLITDFDRKNFDVICYDATQVADDVNKALHAAATDWRGISNINDEELASIIRDDAIDILVDLSGHTRGNRLKAFGLKPAPLQVSGIGHLSPGISTIDYRLTTDRVTPPDEDKIYPEKPIYLDTYFGFTAPKNAPQLAPPPCRKNGFITFGFLGRFIKTSDDLLAVWARILLDIPNSRLLLKYSQLDDPASQQKTKDLFSGLGIANDRLTLLGKTEQRQHLDAHNRVDIVFDSFPHGGGMTTMDSLWMGVPVIGLLDPHKAGGRILDGICRPLGLGNWVARSPDEYHALAVQWAGRAEDLTELRQELRQKVADVYSRFPRDVEKSYRLIWQRLCKGEAPSPLYPSSSVR